MGKRPLAQTNQRRIRNIQPDPFVIRSLERRFAEAKELEAALHYKEAEKIYREIAGTSERFHMNAGIPYAAVGFALICQGKHAEAEEALKRSLKLEPRLLETHINLGAVYRSMRRWKECEKYSKQALEIEPKDTRARLNLGAAQSEMARYGAAVQSFLLVLALEPEHLEARKGIATNYISLGETAVSIPMFRKIIEMEPDNLTNYSHILFAMQYEPTVTNEDVLEDHRKFGRKARQLIGPADGETTSDKNSERVIRIGYVSGDYKNHVVMRFVENVLAAHDRSRVEVCCISTTTVNDDRTERIKAIADQWVDVRHVNDEQAAELIRELKLDIAIDLCGHSSVLRLPLFARRLAPIHVTWCGYSGTTGLDNMDYIVVDNVIAPPGEPVYFTERPLRLPGPYVCFTPVDPPDIGPLPFQKNGYITFGCMNNPGKVNKYVIGWWAQLLHAVPNSRLLMRYHLLADPLVQERINKVFRPLGLEHRVDMRSGGGNLLDAYNEVDIALDTFPYNGTTTTCEALWMGVPVVTLKGDRFVARVGASLLTSVGWSDLIGETPQEYIDCAIRLAGEPERLAAFRENARTDLSKTLLYDPRAFTKLLEDGYVEIFRRWCES
jgi:predicted O-linked N-acetylglucosamine transferase (SPINDLY family)